VKVPWLTKSEISKKAVSVIGDYQGLVGHPVKPPIPVEDIIERCLKVRFGFADLEAATGVKDVLGATYVEKKMICINERLLDDKYEGRMIFTCAHEVGHWVLHRPYVKEAKRLGLQNDAIICRTSNAKEPIEWQADFFAGSLLMPADAVKEAFYKVCGKTPLELYNRKSAFRVNALYFDPSVESWPYIAAAVCEAGYFTNVSKQAMIIRLQRLGLLVNLTDVQLGWSRSRRLR
jgi:Zn-dependent peptidase ImmA (M78 family)